MVVYGFGGGLLGLWLRVAWFRLRGWRILYLGCCRRFDLALFLEGLRVGLGGGGGLLWTGLHLVMFARMAVEVLRTWSGEMR